MIGYNQKMVISGDFIEFYEFQKTIFKGFEKVEEIKEKTKRVINNITWHKSQYALTRTRRNIRRLINSNKTLTKFLTLTFSENVCNIDIANYEFKKFIERLKYAYPKLDLKYLTVIEFQNRGAVHYHMLLNTPYIKAKEFSKLWRNGFIKINKVKNCDNLGAYVSKYLSKESTERLYNKKKFFCSTNLERPFETVDNFTIDNLLETYKLKSVKPRYETIIENDFVGKIYYYQFKLNFDD